MAAQLLGTERILHFGRPLLRPRYTQPVLVKRGNVFLLCAENGDILADSEQGLYFHDMRYLSAQFLAVDAYPPVTLLSDASQGWNATYQLAEPDITGEDGSLLVRKEALGIRREKRLGCAYREALSLEKYANDSFTVVPQLGCDADLADMFTVRGTAPGTGRAEPGWLGSCSGREGRDSNPGTPCNRVNRLAGDPIRPLWHLPRCALVGGEGGIRTPGAQHPTVFKTAALNHSATSPGTDPSSVTAQKSIPVPALAFKRDRGRATAIAAWNRARCGTCHITRSPALIT